MPLTDEEAAELERLSKKRDEPDPPAGGRSENVDYYVDLSDEAAVERAIGFGLLTQKEADELGGDGGGGDGDDKSDDKKPAPRRGGYFQE